MSDMDVDKPAHVPGQYTEHTNPQGRMYWYDTINKTSHWEKPPALQTAFERAMAATPWKEYTSKGRKYWVHGETKKSVWELPDELVKLKEEHGEAEDVEMKPTTTPQLPTAQPFFPPPAAAVLPHGLPAGPKSMVRQGSAPLATLSPAAAAAAGLPTTPLAAQAQSGSPGPTTPGSSTALALIPQAMLDTLPANPSASAAASAISPPLPSSMPDHNSHHDSGYLNNAGPRDRYVIPPKGWPTAALAEEAFEYLLQKAGVEAGWTWDVAMRAIITDPLYKSLHTLAEKKVVFNRYLVNLKETQAQERAARLARLRPQFHKLLDGHPQVYPYSTFGTMDRLFAGNAIWEGAPSDERKALWDEFVAELKAKVAAEQRELRTRNLAVVGSIFDELALTPRTRWAQLSATLAQHPRFASDPLLAELDPVDLIVLFEERMAAVEATADAQRAKDRLEIRRAARHAREAFKALLDGYVDSGHITWRSKWYACLPLWKETEEYRTLLGKAGSSALDLFHDVVDDLTLALEAKARSVGALLEDQGVKVELATERPTFDHGLDKIKFQGSEKDRDDLWALMHGRLVAKAAEEERRRERRRRHAIDDVRYAIRKIEPPLPIDAPFEQVQKDVAKLREARDVESAADLKSAWEKHVQRHKERLRERDQPSSSSRDHRSHERDPSARGIIDRSERPSSRELNYLDRSSSRRESGVDGRGRDDRGEKRSGGGREGEKEGDPRDAKRAKVQAELEEGEI